MRVSIIGAGVVGTAIGVLAARAGYNVVAVASRSDDSAARAADRIDGDVAVLDPAEAAAKVLVNQAYREGSRDNITALVVRAHRPVHRGVTRSGEYEYAASAA